MELISVIIPMYNAEPYIRCCLQSLFDQTCQNWEAIIIDDGSADGSLDVCRELAAVDQRIRIISQAHKGVSAARNCGLDAAVGAYVFFLDSDDAIHPLLLDEMILQARKSGADLLSCGQARLKAAQFEPAVRKASVQNQRPVWKTPRKPLHASIFDFERGIDGAGGKMIRRSCVQDLRFREDLFLGEDTYYISQLLNRRIQIAYTLQEWYYYRRRSNSATCSQSLSVDPHYYDVYHLLIEDALAAGYEQEAQKWERSLLSHLRSTCLNVRSSGNAAGMAAIKKIAADEFKRSVFRSLPGPARWSNRLYIFSYPLYVLARKMYDMIYRILRRLLIWLGIHEIGILTFHCSDNFGAMLQAYGLRTYLRTIRKVDAAIINYSPPYMTGRHWYVPYVPFTGSNGFSRCLKNALAGWRRHKNMGRDFFRQRSNMRRFRRHFLTWNNWPAFFDWQLRFVPCRCYVVGSDQIWNPDITLGLRRAYFGAFPGLRKKRVVAYAASLGSKALPNQYDQQFASLLSHVDAVSVREASAIPYLQSFRSDPVVEVLDPVFLLGREKWQCLERLPARNAFILLYVTENDSSSYEYARRLSREKGLPVVQLKAAKWGADGEFDVDYTAGPAEFLGYIHQADYVVTNSFHAVAFSIIYQKQFMAFLHSTLGTRVRNVLQIHNLESRIYREGAEIDAPIDWNDVLARSRENVRLSQEFIDRQIH